MNEELTHKKRYRTLIKNTAKAADDGIQKEHVTESLDVSFDEHANEVNKASMLLFGKIVFNTEIIKE